jgi:hypothetical protein
MTVALNQGGPGIELQRSLPSEVAAISPFVDSLLLLFGKYGCVSDGVAPRIPDRFMGRRIYLMKALMDEVRFEEGGAVVHMRKNAGQSAGNDRQRNSRK